MEGCPRLPTIGFDAKISVESVSLCEKIPSYITSTYQENGDKYSSECEQMNRLRQNAMNASVDQSGLQVLKQYYCQLQLLRNRFPMLPETECAVRFTWEDAFQKEDNTYNDIRFEESSILYNIGAIYSRLGANEPRRTHDSIKNACTYFRCAAACFEKVRDQYTTYTTDLTPDLLTCQVHILLAQAHEAVLEKSLIDQRPASVNAHIAMQISEYYQMAVLNLTKPGINSIVSKRFREWRVTLTYKLSYYLALTYYCSGLIADENKKRGQAVCYYESAIERLKEAWKNAEKISSDKTNVFKDAHVFTNDVLMGRYQGAKRDNDSVYFEKVPALSSLPAIQGAIVAKPQPFDCHDPEVCGADIFQKLVPLDAHLATSEYSEEKAKLLREIIELTENKNRELETFMLCLQLDRVPLNNEYLRLPRELLDCCAAVTVRPNMSKDLVSAMQQLNSQHHEVADQVNEFEQSLQTLEETNDSIKSNKDFKDLQINLKTIREMLSQANDSNIELHRHMTTIIDHTKILGSSLEQLEKTLPIISELDDEANKSKLARLVLLNEKVHTMKKQREMLLSDFRQKIREDDITKLVLMQRQENHKGLFSEQMKKHEELVNIIKQNCTAQENILQSLTEANADIADIRTKIGTTFETRSRLIQEYINSFKSFEDTLSKANEGIEFYKKQSTKLGKLTERLNTLQSQHQPPRTSSHRQLPPTRPSRHSALPTWSNPDVYQPDFSVNNIPSSPVPDRPRLKDYLATMKPDTWGSSTDRSSKRISARRDENMYIPPPVSNTNDNNHFHSNIPPTSADPLYSSVPGTAGPMLTSMPTFSPRHYQVQSPIHSEHPSMSYAPPPTQPLAYQQSKYNHSYPVDPGSTLLAQNFSSQPQMTYNPPTTQPFIQHPQYHSSQPIPTAQQTFQQPPPSQQPIHHPFPNQQPAYPPPPPPPQQRQTDYPSVSHQPPQQPAPHALPTQQPVYQPQQQPAYYSSSTQQPIYQSPQQPNGQSPVNHQQAYQPPPQQPAHHWSSIQQPVYQPPAPQQPFYPSSQQPPYQLPSFPQPTYQAPPTHQMTHPSSHQQPSSSQQTNQHQLSQFPQAPPSQQLSFQPNFHPSQNVTDSNRPNQTTLPPAKFDPYRPQPMGTYDIPKPQNPPYIPLPPQPSPPPAQPSTQQYQTVASSYINPHDVYRPGGLLSTNPPQLPSPSVNNNNYDPNQFVQSAPPPPLPPVSLVPSPAASTTQNVPNTPVPNQSPRLNIADDLLSLALEQQIEASSTDTNNTEPTSPAPQSITNSSVDEELPVKSNGKPIACIQPLSIISEEKHQSPPLAIPATNLSPLQDPYDDKDKLDQLVADVQRFEKHVSTMTKKILNGTVPLEAEWKELSDLQEKDVHTQTCAIGKCNPKINRFQDLIPYDNSRIRLVQTNPNQQKHFNDYINATSIGRIRDASFLVAQYPLASSIAEFWSMIYDQHVAIVAVLLRPDEMQSINVYPQKVGDELKFSSFTITLLSTKSPNQLTNHRIIRLQHLQTNQSRTVVWLEHLGWPPKEMPENPMELLKFIQEAQHYLIQTRNRRGTVLVTCLSGVSRTGPFISLFTSIQDIDEGRPFPDLNKIVRLLRTKRRHMIQDMNQLKFVYEALLSYVQTFLVKRGVLKVGSIIHSQSSFISTGKSSSFNNINTSLLLNDEMQTIMEKAKPIPPSTPNYDVGPILSSTPTSTITEDKPSIKQLTPIEENFNLRPEESHIKPKSSRDDFFRSKSSDIKDLSDPFNQLDPFWTLRQ